LDERRKKLREEGEGKNDCTDKREGDSRSVKTGEK
jgi:hypothetical protein